MKSYANSVTDDYKLLQLFTIFVSFQD